ncbi:MAG: DUF2853 family protein [Alphaproteobacteria bacterium]|nr:DUF2853 family protein [Alphaproteobacteria bacterium]
MSKYLDDVRQYDKKASEDVVKKFEKYLGIALRNRDSRFVAASSKKELGSVRTNFLKKKLGMKGTDAELDKIVNHVAKQMNGQRMKNRLTFYYLCAKKADMLSVFS